MAYFPAEKTDVFKKLIDFFSDQTSLSEVDILKHLNPGVELLSPIHVSERLDIQGQKRFDACIKVSGPMGVNAKFWVEVKNHSTPSAIWDATARVQDACSHDALPLIIVPYLNPQRIAELESRNISGIDLCGNGFIHIPGRIYVQRTGNPNRYKDSRPLNNPYKGLSAMVARILLRQPRWTSLSELVRELLNSGASLSLPQASKAVSALKEDLILSSKAGNIELLDPLRLLDNLGNEWRPPVFQRHQLLNASDWTRELPLLEKGQDLQWALMGESSAAQHAMFSQSGPIRVAVTDIRKAMDILNLEREDIRNFATIELVESDYAGFYFDNFIDGNRVRWASQLQTWLELQAGDARQREAAKDIRRQILGAVKAKS